MARTLSDVSGMVWLDVSKLAIENECLEEYDEVYQCRVLDEEKVIISCCHINASNCVYFYGLLVARWNGGSYE